LDLKWGRELDSSGPRLGFSGRPFRIW
jgi:hypothetical protein